MFQAVTPSQHASRSTSFSRAWRSYSQSCSALLMEFPQLCCSRWDSQAPRNRYSTALACALALHHCCALPSWIPARASFSKSPAVLQAEPSWEQRYHSTDRVWQFDLLTIDQRKNKLRVIIEGTFSSSCWNLHIWKIQSAWLWLSLWA